MNYKDEKKDDINNIAHLFKELLINAHQDCFSNINTIKKLFLTQFDLLQNIKSTNTINTLANNTFKYQITSVNITILFVNLTAYSYTILINMPYNNFKFKELLINSNTTTQFTDDLG